MTKTIGEWLAGKDIFVTGCTGFIGKGLVEKLLRATDVNKIYVLIRRKLNLSAKQRFQQLTQHMMYERLRRERPDAFNKVVVVEGNAADKGLGISDEDKQELINNVSIIFHAAACVRFDDPLSNAILLNVRGTRDLLEIVKSMKKLECFQYVSTTFCNCNLNLSKIEEKVYIQDYDWSALIAAAEKDDILINILEKKILAKHPNTYTLCKSLAEMVINDYKENLPIVIYRPSVVVGSVKEPEPGWLDNYNGPVGVTLGVSSGVLRVFRGNPNAYLDYVCVDYVFNGMIVTAWLTSKMTTKELSVYNCAYGDLAAVTFAEVVENGVLVNHELPLNNDIWYPFLIVCDNTYYYHFLFYILQFLPGLLIDLMLLVLRKEPLLTKLNVKIYNAGAALHYFSSRIITFDNTKYKAVFDKVPPEEKEIYYMYPKKEEISSLEFMLLFQKGLKKYLLNEKEADLEKFRAKHWRLYYIDRATKLFLLIGVFWFCMNSVLSLINVIL
ncbi:fatty acyl-CoA reductase 1-like [Rhodnius prolixus]|uniref:Fatty acyl-CoA reductase n=2 Tax=Rhodnius prolixus TaxID=13249 RepID=T1HRJ2_RHOPR